jgi:HSP20 family molecular chaperone IbpA
MDPERDIELTVSGDVLTIKAERREEPGNETHIKPK